MLKKLFDNRFWYIGVTHMEFGGKDYENNPCVMIRNPFGGWSPEPANVHCEAYKKAYQELKNKTRKAKDD